MGIKERIITSQTSSNLGEVIEGDMGDIDMIRACGAVAATNPLGISLWRLKYSNDAKEFPFVVRELRHLVERYGKAKGIAAADHLVTRVLKFWFDDTCHECNGMGFELMEHAPVLSEKACKHCHGTGKITLENATPADDWLLDRINTMERQVAGAVMRKLADDLE